MGTGTEATVWVFTGPNASFPAGVFTARHTAEDWIRRHSLSGTLTEYPVDEGAYDWAVRNGYFVPKPSQANGSFIGRCGFRSKPIADSGASRSPIPVQGDHRFRSKPIAERMSL